MPKSLKILLFTAVIGAVLVILRLQAPAQPAAVVTAPATPDPVESINRANPQPLLPGEAPERLEILPQGKYVIDVVLHSYDEIEKLLDKAEASALQPRPAGATASIALVLHGPEIDLFSIKNYARYHELVDRAARLDAYNVIEVKMCQTSMRLRGVRNEDVPGFIELVPFGPDEIKRLQQRGYVKI